MGSIQLPGEGGGGHNNKLTLAGIRGHSGLRSRNQTSNSGRSLVSADGRIVREKMNDNNCHQQQTFLRPNIGSIRQGLARNLGGLCVLNASGKKVKFNKL